jgi:hypothetical protein
MALAIEAQDFAVFRERPVTAALRVICGWSAPVQRKLPGEAGNSSQPEYRTFDNYSTRTGQVQGS